MIADDALAATAAAEPWALPLLAALIETNSHADNLDGVAACRRLLAGPLADLGFAMTEPGNGNRRHLDARTPRRGGRPTVLLLGHLDTVFPPDHPFRGVRRDGDRWYGPGAADMKGGVVTALVAVAALRALGLADRFDLRLFLSCDEEVGSPTALPLLAAAAAGADVALCFEAARPGGELVVARKGYGHARVVVHGRTGHAGIAHDRAINALTVLARFVVAAEALEAGELTVSPGGRVEVSPAALACVPDRAEAELEWRFFDAAEGAAMPARLAELAAGLAAATGARIDVAARVETPAMPATDAGLALLDRYAAAGRALGIPVAGARTAGVGDINVVAATGVACLDGVGPEGDGFHGSDEHVVVPSIARRAALTVAALAGIVT